MLLMATTAGLVLSVALAFYFSANKPLLSPIVPLPMTFATPSQPTAGVPVRLYIPSINVDAPVESLGLTTDGAMDAPKGPDEVAWYKLGPRPGEKGSAVIAGHSKWNKGAPAAFDKINKLRQGDKLYVADADGITVVFVVRELRDYDQKANAATVFGSSDSKAHLNLITCEGVWNKTSKTYSKRLVVFTDRE